MAGTSEKLEIFLKEQMDYIAAAHGLSLTKSETYSRFEELIFLMGKNDKVVILIDEYDKPIIDHLETENRAAEMREVLRGFFSVLKGCDQYIRFLFLTGVSKFSQAGTSAD